jgi:exonuclease SbcC
MALEREISQEVGLRDSIKTTDEELVRLNAEREIALASLKGEHHQSHAEERAALNALERREVELSTRLIGLDVRIREAENELAKFNEMRLSLTDEFQEKERLEAIAEVTGFIRDTLKEAAPRVAKNYVYHVSLEANQMFREIMGDATRSLKWAEDYSVVLEEDGFERPFASLSGGEQMAAALAIRLGLLKQLSDIRIAFFDEPTTNMDVERRDNLAQQISRITNFDQLFVISHDETFDNFVDNVVEVRRDDANR